MNLWQRMIMTRRYAPFLVLAVAQLVLVLVAPSVGLTKSSNPFADVGAGADLGAGADGTAAQGAASTAAGAGGAATGGTTAGRTSGPGGAAGARKAVATNALGIPTTGDTSHCVGGRQFGDLTTAPPCVPKWPGGNNGGHTYQGVNDNSIEIVYYREKDNPVVKQIEQQINVYSDPADQTRFAAAAEKFINSKYEFYGRHVHIDIYPGSCDPSPPVDSCFRSDVDALNSQYKPFGVIYENNTAIPGFFQQATADGIVSMGGWHFSDKVFNNVLRPFHYDAYMGGDSQALISGEYWCKKLAGKVARFATGKPGTGLGGLQTTKRRLAIVSIDNQYNRPAAEHLADVVQGCDPNFNRQDLVFYSSDITTATQQANTTVHELSKDGVTSVFFFGDPIAPLYFTKACSSQNFYPEHVLVGSGLIDYDPLGRLYDPDQWAHAFGPSDIPTPLPIDKSDAAIVWHAAGNASPPYNSANLPWSYFNLMANGLQTAGPHLDPGTLERGAFSAPVINDYNVTHDQYHAETVIRPGKYTAITDQREVYWDKNATSPVDNKVGAYVVLNDGHRYAPGGWSGGEPSLPPGV